MQNEFYYFLLLKFIFSIFQLDFPLNYCIKRFQTCVSSSIHILLSIIYHNFQSAYKSKWVAFAVFKITWMLSHSIDGWAFFFEIFQNICIIMVEAFFIFLLNAIFWISRLFFLQFIELHSSLLLIFN